jgi:multidrug efflux pump subunit AcrA (membrane-fusion protein)
MSKPEASTDDEISMARVLQTVLSKRKLLISTIIVAVVVILVALIVAGRENKPAQAAPRPLDVEVIQVEQRDVPIYSEWIGTTDGMVNADIKAQVTGYLLRQDYKEGSFVKKGQSLFEIDSRPFQAALDQASGQVAQFQGQLEQAVSQVSQAEAQVAQANSQILQSQAQLAQAQANQIKTQLDVNKYAPLAEQKAVTQQDYDNAAQSNVVAKAQVEAAKAAVETARAQLRYANAQIAGPRRRRLRPQRTNCQCASHCQNGGTEPRLYSNSLAHRWYCRPCAGAGRKLDQHDECPDNGFWVDPIRFISRSTNEST